MILIITGHLAYPLVSQMAEKSKKETVVHIAEKSMSILKIDWMILI